MGLIVDFKVDELAVRTLWDVVTILLVVTGEIAGAEGLIID